MTFTQAFLLFFLVVQLIHFLGTWKLYIKADRKAWEAAVPIYNAFILMRIINRPKEWYWVILLFIPIVNLIVFPVLWVETIRSFGRTDRAETILVVLTLGLYIFYVNYALDVQYVHERSLKPRSTAGEWVASILFAVVAATLVHTYVMQPFVIPTSSLEKTLLVGDFLFVSKVHYGARTPMTPIALPMVHDEIPLTGIKSYVKEPQLPYWRFPGFESIERNDIVVFNWPADEFEDINAMTGYVEKPVDKRSNYVKRCVGLPGDQLEVRNGYVYIDGKKNELPDRAKLQFSYYVKTKGRGFNKQYLHDRYDITDAFGATGRPNEVYFSAITEQSAQAFKNHPNVSSIEKAITPKGQREPNIFPKSEKYNWNNYHYGPIEIPYAGQKVELTMDNLPLYKRAISEYEGNNLTVKDNQILIDGEVVTSYTFKQDYYWMMGDNRGNSQDSRSWGFVPFDHVLGKPTFIWMSWDTNASGFNKIRWNRLFTTVSGEGEPISYFPYFLIVLAGWFGFSYYRKRKREGSK
ncbi:signal peptidase I [Kordia periserrulae]|uniref:Signal peptidase I n=1 Tax=Kordia periserrulae TaxID=701523 RepID=A0A2T6C0X5_9FLAO|nr:signal peptidase I [Kordia periserrulae]PTX61952.1 signal peptidase I [Kordia periserrulae]